MENESNSGDPVNGAAGGREDWDARLMAARLLVESARVAEDPGVHTAAALEGVRQLDAWAETDPRDHRDRSRAMSWLTPIGTVLALGQQWDELDRIDGVVCAIGDHRHENPMDFSVLHYRWLEAMIERGDPAGVCAAIRVAARRARAAPLAHRWHALAELCQRAVEFLADRQRWYEVGRVLVDLQSTPEIFLHESTGTIARTLATWSRVAFRAGAIEEAMGARRRLVEFHELWPIPPVLEAYLSVLEVVIGLAAEGDLDPEEGRRGLRIVASIQRVKPGEPASLAVLRSCRRAARSLLDPESPELKNLEETLAR